MRDPLMPNFWVVTLISLLVFFWSYLCHNATFVFYIKTYVGKTTYRNRRNRKKHPQTFAGRYLYMDFRDCVPKRYYVYYFVSMISCVVFYIAWLWMTPTSTGERNAMAGNIWIYSLSFIVACNILPGLPFVLRNRFRK